MAALAVVIAFALPPGYCLRAWKTDVLQQRASVAAISVLGYR